MIVDLLTFLITLPHVFNHLKSRRFH